MAVTLSPTPPYPYTVKWLSLQPTALPLSLCQYHHPPALSYSCHLHSITNNTHPRHHHTAAAMASLHGSCHSTTNNAKTTAVVTLSLTPTHPCLIMATLPQQHSLTLPQPHHPPAIVPRLIAMATIPLVTSIFPTICGVTVIFPRLCGVTVATISTSEQTWGLPDAPAT